MRTNADGSKLLSLFCDSPGCRPVDKQALIIMKKPLKYIRDTFDDPARRPSKHNSELAKKLNSDLEEANKRAVRKYNLLFNHNKTMATSKAFAEALDELASGAETSRPGLSFLVVCCDLCLFDRRNH